MVINSLHEYFEIIFGRCRKAQGNSTPVIFIGAFFKAKVKNRVFVKLDSRYADYFPEYWNNFGRALRLLKFMYGMKKYGKLFGGEVT